MADADITNPAATLKTDLPEKLEEYLHTECGLPLSRYEDGGVFTSYIGNSGMSGFHFQMLQK